MILQRVVNGPYPGRNGWKSSNFSFIRVQPTLTAFGRSFAKLLSSTVQMCRTLKISLWLLALIVLEIWDSQKSINWEDVRNFHCLDRHHARYIRSIGSIILKASIQIFAHLFVSFHNYNSYSCSDIRLTNEIYIHTYVIYNEYRHINDIYIY